MMSPTPQINYKSLNTENSSNGFWISFRVSMEANQRHHLPSSPEECPGVGKKDRNIGSLDTNHSDRIFCGGVGDFDFWWKNFS